MSKNIKIHCLRCGNSTQQTRCGSANETELVEHTMENESYSEEINFEYCLMQCDVCKTISVQVFSEVWNYEPEQVYPAIKDLSGVPSSIQQSYSEAKKVRNISPIAFAVLIRRSIEYICKDQKAKGRNLEKKLKDLSDREIIPKTLSRMTHAIRYFGNLGAHASDSLLEQEDVFIMDDFFLAIVEYVYIAPNKIKRAQQRAKKITKK